MRGTCGKPFITHLTFTHTLPFGGCLSLYFTTNTTDSRRFWTGREGGYLRLYFFFKIIYCIKLVIVYCISPIPFGPLLIYNIKYSLSTDEVSHCTFHPFYT